MDWVEPEKFMSANGDGRAQLRALVRDVHERLAQLNGAAPEQLIVGVWGPRDGVCVVALGGEMDMSNAAELGHALSGRGDLARCRVVVELSALRFIDSTGIKELIHLAKLTKASAGTIILAAPSPHVARVLELVRFEQIVTIQASLEAALDHARDRSEFKDAPIRERVSRGTSTEAGGVSDEPS
jgi:anti-anti-sigma factor